MDRPSHEKEDDARDEVEPERMDVTSPPPGVEVVCQLPRVNEQLIYRMKKLRVPVQERIRGVQQNAKDRTAIIDRVLSAIAAELAGQGCAAIFAMRQWCVGQFRPALAAKDSAPSRRFLGHGGSGISENDLLDFVAHGICLIQSRPRRGEHHRDLRGSGEIRRSVRVARRLTPENSSRCNRARWSRWSSRSSPAIG